MRRMETLHVGKYGSRIREGKITSHDLMLLQPHQLTYNRNSVCYNKEGSVHATMIKMANTYYIIAAMF